MTLLHDSTSIPFSEAIDRASVAGTAKKIVVIASYAPSLTNFRLELLKRMVEAGHVLHAFAPEDDRAVKVDLAAIGVNFEQMPMSRAGMNPFEDLMTLAFLLRRLRRISPDVVVPYTMKPIIYGGIAARMLGIPKRCFLITGLGHVFSDAGATSAKGRSVRAVSVALYRIALSGADAVFSYNDADMGDIERYRLLGTGVGLEVFFFLESEHARKNRIRECADMRVIRFYGLVETRARRQDLVFGTGQFIL